MKLNGSKLAPPKPIEVVIPRGDGESVVLVAQAVLDFDEFDKMCPAPKPPMVVRAGQLKGEPDREDADYKKLLAERGVKQYAWLLIKSLSATPGLEWEHVNPNDPTTFELIYKELKEAGFTTAERNIIIGKVLEANAMDESKLEEARKRFLLQRQAR